MKLSVQILLISFIAFILSSSIAFAEFKAVKKDVEEKLLSKITKYTLTEDNINKIIRLFDTAVTDLDDTEWGISTKDVKKILSEALKSSAKKKGVDNDAIKDTVNRLVDEYSRILEAAEKDDPAKRHERATALLAKVKKELIEKYTLSKTEGEALVKGVKAEIAKIIKAGIKKGTDIKKTASAKKKAKVIMKTVEPILKQFYPTSDEAYVATVNKAMDKLSNPDATELILKAKENMDKLFGINWGVGLALTISNNRVDEARVDGSGIVRVDKERNDFPRIVLETHYFFETKDVLKGSFWPNGWGPFIAINSGENNIISGGGGGLMVAWKKNTFTAASNSSLNLGIGYFIDTGVKMLADELKEGEKHPEYDGGNNKTPTIRYKETSQKATLLIASFTFY